MRRDGADALGVVDELRRCRWRRIELSRDVCPFIRLGGETWPSYLAKLGATHRANFRRRLRQVQAKFDVRLERAESEEERRAAFATFLRLHLDRWREAGGSDGLGSPSLVAFHEEMTEVARREGWLRLFVLRFDEVPVASIYGFRYGRVFSFYQSGFDRAFAKASVGLVMMGLAIEAAIDEGVEEYDLLHGAERYKFLWARETRELARLELYPGRARHRIMARARSAKRSARRAVRAIVNRLREPRAPAPAAAEGLIC
jgi:CelD/BcsL family acetyltransferase involved in cellulose biosynthesis